MEPTQVGSTDILDMVSNMLDVVSDMLDVVSNMLDVVSDMLDNVWIKKMRTEVRTGISDILYYPKHK